jgi:hypothetical protein
MTDLSDELAGCAARIESIANTYKAWGAAMHEKTQEVLKGMRISKDFAEEKYAPFVRFAQHHHGAWCIDCDGFGVTDDGRTCEVAQALEKMGVL